MGTQQATNWLSVPDTSTAYHDALIPLVFVIMIGGPDLGPPLGPADFAAFPVENTNADVSKATTATVTMM